MAGRIISVVNRKGGVGKTTVTLGLADTLIAETETPFQSDAPVVLAVDLDPQGSLTRALLYQRDAATQSKLQQALEARHTFAACVEDRLTRAPKSADDYLTRGVGPIGTHYTMLANDATAWDVERRALRTTGEQKLKAAVTAILRELAGQYRYVLVDAPPGQTVVAEAAIQGSDLVLCPTSPDLLSFWGLESFDQYITELCAGTGAPPARYVFTKWRKRAPQWDPQDRVHELMDAFAAPAHHVTLLREVGKRGAVSSQSIALPFDPKVAARLEGAPNPRKQWPWSKMYTADTQAALKSLVSAVKYELKQRDLNSNGPRRTAA